MTLNESNPHWKLVQRYADGITSAKEVTALEETLADDPEFRKAFLTYLSLDAALEDTLQQTGLPPRAAIKRLTLMPVFGLIGVMCLIAISVYLLKGNISAQTVVAQIGETSNDLRWLSNSFSKGSDLKEGTRLELASGDVEIRFTSGALTRLHGPALFEIVSNNSGFLSYGKAHSVADNDESKGFTIQTHSGDFVDQGTEFLTTASPDGYSQLHVKSGAVDVAVPGMKMQRLRTGSGFGIEPGEIPVVVRIEQGTETSDFQFPTIPPPRSSDFADAGQGNSTIEWWPSNLNDKRNHPSKKSGPLELLINGKGQTTEDSPSESVFFRDGANGLFLIDLGASVPVAKINTYSWHRNWEDPALRRRAVQRFTLWGCGGEKPNTLPTSKENAGWTRIARVNTDAFFQVKSEPDRPPQQACSIFSGDNAIGQFRYLLFEVSPTPMPDGLPPRHTFFGEIDVMTSR
jgi:ferric-dicitrate binding protein FerR (iron transport regulator)